MQTFALISEGITDQIAIGRIVEEFSLRTRQSEIEVVPFRPRRDQTDLRQAQFGGWLSVLEALPDAALEALSVNDFVIIHLDTDVCEEAGFDVPRTVHGTLKSPSHLIADVICRIVREIGIENYLKNCDRIIFAVPYFTSECWLIELLFPDSPGNRILNCEDRLSRLCAANRLRFQKSAEFYHNLCRKIRLKKNFDFSKCDESLRLFLERVNASIV